MIRTSLPFVWGGSLGLLSKPHLTLLPSNTSTALTLSSGGTYSVIFAFLSLAHFRLLPSRCINRVMNSWKAISSLHLQAFSPPVLPGGAFAGTLAVVQLFPFLLWELFHRIYLLI